MPGTVVCEQCGKAIEKEAAVVVVVDSWPHYFCSEACKIEWAEQPPTEEE